MGAKRTRDYVRYDDNQEVNIVGKLKVNGEEVGKSEGVIKQYSKIVEVPVGFETEIQSTQFLIPDDLQSKEIINICATPWDATDDFLCYVTYYSSSGTKAAYLCCTNDQVGINYATVKVTIFYID